MIHLLQVTPDMTPAQLQKLARRYAMTGGYELALAEGVDSSGLEHLITVYLPAIEKYPRGSMARKSSNAFRILMLASGHPALSPRGRELLTALQA